jgi:hypothetical protein
MENQKRAEEVYQTIMRWLENRGFADVPESKGGFLEIPVLSPPENDNVEAVQHTLKFRRVVTMGGGSYAEHIGTGIKIVYDPNWEALLKIEKLLTI